MVTPLRFAVLMSWVSVVASTLWGCTTILGIDTEHEPNACAQKSDKDIKYKLCGLGACAVLTPECENGLPKLCVGDLTLKSKEDDCGPSGQGDYIDNDCDGDVDEDCACDGKTPSKACYTNSKSTRGLGRCMNGTQKCQSGFWTRCEGDIVPAKEECGNGRDDNCNGHVDEDCPCTKNQTQPCFSGPESTIGVLPCTPGTQSCSPDGTWTDCTRQVTPKPEECNGTDDDCNGTIDDNPNCCHTLEDCPLGDICFQGVCQITPRCDDLIKNGAETDIDCGGTDCPKCPDDKACTVDLDCISNLCPAELRKCKRKTLGSHCKLDDECTSGFCVDGVCCNEPCKGLCRACIAAITQTNAPDGTCASVGAGFSDGNDCTTDAQDSCKQTGACDGNGQCQLYTNTTICAPASCTSATVLHPASTCDGARTCVVKENFDCAPYACSAGACKATCANDPDCAATAYCDSETTSLCFSKKDKGVACNKSKECISGSCVDGYCCDTACTGTCTACNVAGVVGTCTTVPSGQVDNTCSAPKACDEQGRCVSTAGTPCMTNPECLGGFCVDGYCCNSACSGVCQSCSNPTSVGTCSNVPSRQTDTNPVCSDEFRCDGRGGCRKDIGQLCTTNGDCLSDFCVDSVCCDSACDSPCQVCNAAATKGKCSAVDRGASDNLPTCSGKQACDGAGHCLPNLGETCSLGNSACASGFCVDGVCCSTGCDGTCTACNGAGICTNVANLTPDVGCSGNSVCNGNGACLLTSGKACTVGEACLSGFCADGVCCNSTCNGICEACNLTNSLGVCSAVPSQQQDTNTCEKPGVCNGSRACVSSNGNSCSSPGNCLSGFCVDDVCCDSSCSGQCQSCNLSGKLGTCSLVPSGVQDPNSCSAASQLCDGNGKCQSTTGATCTASSPNSCISGNCVDGVCCNSSSCGTCQACNLNGSGTCSAVSRGNTDPGTCTTACDGSGVCLAAGGSSCTLATAASCASGYCVDNVCCGSASCGTCRACNLSGNGVCSAVSRGQTDTDTCSTTCDGNGICLGANGASCNASTAATCASGNCVDGVCCSSPSCGTCQSCNLNGSGTCSNIQSGQVDSDSCTGSRKICDGSGQCKTENGGTCTAATASSCVTSNCVDGVCCQAADCGTCRACNLSGSGTCSPVSKGQTDPGTCAQATQACDGTGICRAANGTACTPGTAASCASGNCVDGVCCGSASCGTCSACNLNGVGTCSAVAAGSGDPDSCSSLSGKECTATGACKDANGTMCTTIAAASCASGNCVDSVCCGSASCGTCSACDLNGVGTCSPVSEGETDPGTCAQAVQACDGAGACKDANGTTCSPGTAASCASGNCVDGVCCSAAVCANGCGGDGNCIP